MQTNITEEAVQYTYLTPEKAQFLRRVLNDMQYDDTFAVTTANGNLQALRILLMIRLIKRTKFRINFKDNLEIYLVIGLTRADQQSLESRIWSIWYAIYW